MSSPLDCFGEPLHLLEMIYLSASSITCKTRISIRRRKAFANNGVVDLQDMILVHPLRCTAERLRLVKQGQSVVSLPDSNHSGNLIYIFN